MMDITARLRRHPYSWTSVHHEAAQEIERLRLEVSKLRDVAEAAVLYCTTGQDRGGEKLLDAVARFKWETK
jgi:hypothetical protein